MLVVFLKFIFLTRGPVHLKRTVVHKTAVGTGMGLGQSSVPRLAPSAMTPSPISAGSFTPTAATPTC